MGSFSGELAVVQYQDQIGLTDTGCSLGYQESGGVSAKLVERFPKCRICGKVKSTGTVVQDQDLRLFHKGAGNGKSLALATGKVPAVLFQLKIQLAIFFLHDLTGLGSGKSLPHFLICGVFPSPA